MPKLPIGFSPETARRSLLTSDEQHHLLTVAPTGAGKGVGCIIPALLSWDGPSVIIDPKGENFAVTADYRRSLGQRVAVLDPFGVTGFPSDSLNPLDIAKLQGSDLEDDVWTVVGLLIANVRSVDDPFWDERASALLYGALLRNVLAFGDRAHVGCLYDFCANNPSAEFGLMQSHSHRDVRAGAAVLDPALASKTSTAIIATASSHVSFLRNQKVCAALKDSSIPIGDIQSGAPMTIYIVLPPDRMKAHAKLLRLWVGVIMTAFMRRRRPVNVPTLVLLDEAAQLGELDELRTMLTLLRGYGVRVWTFWQDIAQIKRLYGADWPTIMNNCGIQQFFGASTPFAAAEVEAYLAGLSPRMLLKLRKDEMVLCRSGRMPEIAGRLNYLENSHLRAKAKANPFHLPPTTMVLPFSR